MSHFINYLRDNKNNLLIFGLIIIISLPVIVFPMTTDHSIFLRGGQTILDGKTLYKDFIDVKPPFIYYLFSLIILLFGTSTLAVGFAEFILLTLNNLCIFLFVKKFYNKNTAVLSVFIYAISYIALNYGYTFQCETVAAIPILASAFFILRKKNAIDLVLSGFFAGFAFGIKYTLGIILVGILFHLLNEKESFKIKVITSLKVLLGFILGSLICLSPLFFGDTFKYFVDSLVFTRFYISAQQMNSDFIKESLKILVVLFADRYSLLLTFLMIFGAFFSLFDTRKENKVSKYLLLNVVLLYLGFIIERRFYLYHFSRIYVFTVIFSAIGFNEVFSLVKQKINWKSTYNKAIALCVAIITFVFSPFPRFLSDSYPALLYVSNRTKYDNYFNKAYLFNFSIDEANLLKNEILNETTRDSKKTLVIGLYSSVMYNILGNLSFSSFSLPQYYFNINAPYSWKEKFRSEIQKSDWLIVETCEGDKNFYGHSKSCAESLTSDTLYASSLSKFTIDMTTEYFVLYKRSNL